MKKIDAVLARRSASDKKLAEISKIEKRIFITNDEDFTDYSKEDIFSVIWLRIAQNDPAALQRAFEKLLRVVSDFEGKLIVLHSNSWDALQLGDYVELS